MKSSNVALISSSLVEDSIEPLQASRRSARLNCASPPASVTERARTGSVISERRSAAETNRNEIKSIYIAPF